MHKYIFTDTNLFEQFQPITDIEWLKLAGCDRVTLLVPSVTVRELNEHKDGATRGRLKRKAAAALIALKKYSDQGSPIEIRDGVELDFRQHEPLIDFESHHLDRGLDDDRLIAAAIDFAIEKKLTPESVMIATGDFGLQLKVKAQPLVELLALPDHLRLPDELDADEKRIRELEAEIGALRSARPRLSLMFRNGTNIYKRVLEKREVSDADIRELLDKTRERHPYRKVPEPKGDPLFNFAGRRTAQDYNSRLDEYYASMEAYYRELRTIREWWTSTVELELVLANQGASPAEDVDVRVKLAEDVLSMKESELPKLPKEPHPPGPPSAVSGLASLLGSENLMASFEPPVLHVRPLELPNASIYLVGEGTVEFHIRRLKHLTEEVLPKVYLHFGSGLRSCNLGYEIIAGNVPEALTGTLAIVIE
jgi:hypothetical protein